MPDAAGPARRRHRCALALFVAAAIGAPGVLAHDGLVARIAALTERIAREPANAGLLVERADLYRASRKWTEALGDLDRAAALGVEEPRLDAIRAHVLAGRGDHRGADAAATRVLARDPATLDMLLVRARARRALGRIREAAADLTQALDARAVPDLYVERARLVASAGRGAAPEALAGLDEGLARLGPIVTLALEAIELERRIGRFDAALARLDRLSAGAARQESWLARRGAILEDAGRPDEAKTAYRQALEAIASLPPARRHTRTITALDDDLRAKLARLDRPPHANPQP